jgi:type IV pilus assembly protein PilO
MPRSFNFDWKSVTRDPKQAVRAVLGFLLLANLVAAFFVFQPLGGSVASLDGDISQARRDLAAKQQALIRLRAIAGKSAVAREAGDTFMQSHFLDRESAYSTLESDLGSAAKASGVKARERSFAYEPIEGSDTLGMVTVTANYEGTYADLVEFVYAMDRSKRLLIIDSLAAQPQQGGGVLNITIKLNAFFRGGGLS